MTDLVMDAHAAPLYINTAAYLEKIKVRLLGMLCRAGLQSWAQLVLQSITA